MIFNSRCPGCILREILTALAFDLHGFSRLDFGNALTAQIERELHTNINSRVKI
jgi:hypothetical protein